LPRIQSAPFALTSDGTLLLNLATELSLPELERLLRTPGVFVGLPLSAEEARTLRTRIGDAGAEARAQILGARRKKKRGRKR
jgi:hypothetical protein